MVSQYIMVFYYLSVFGWLAISVGVHTPLQSGEIYNHSYYEIKGFITENDNMKNSSVVALSRVTF